MPTDERDLADDHRDFRDAVRSFLAASVSDADPVWRAVFATAGENGFLGISLPEEHGGAGVDDLRFGAVLAREAMAAGHTALGLRFGLHGWVAGPLLARRGSTEQQRTWLPGLAAGDRIATVAGLEEPDSVVAEPVADGYRLSGKLAAVTGAAECDLLLVAVGTAEGTRIVLVEPGSVAVEPVPAGLGVRGSGDADLVLDDVVVARGAVVGDEDLSGELRADRDLWLGVLGAAGAATALDLAVAYVQERRVFGRPVAEFENTRRALAEIAVELRAAEALVRESLVERATWPLSAAASTTVAAVGTGVHLRAVDEALQLHGGYGYMREYPIAQAFADARYLRLRAVHGMAGYDRVAKALGL